MMSDQKIIANAMSGKTARACDCCVKRRARWYCPSDDAFLCQICDGSVHAANPLARRHERVRLKTASLKRSSDTHPNNLPSWHRGLTKKARTPRHAKNNTIKHNNNYINNKQELNPLATVPELGAEDTTSSQDDDETDDQLLYRVPVFDPLLAELCDSSTGTLDSTAPIEEITKTESSLTNTMLMDGYQPLDMDDFEFTADVETLLGKGLEEEAYGIEELGLNVKNEMESVKIGLFDVVEAADDDELIREPFDLTFEYDDLPSTTYHDEVGIERVTRKEEVCKVEVDDDEKGSEMVFKKGKVMLKLDYEAISKAWATASQRSPWINGQRPEINPADFWPLYMQQGASGMDMTQQLVGENQMGGILAGDGGIIGDGGREARVSRYREKRRTRLFSKKIRYEVRKLNAEKRPRMKGRFVKRSSFVPTATAFSCFPNSTSNCKRI